MNWKNSIPRPTFDNRRKIFTRTKAIWYSHSIEITVSGVPALHTP